MNVRAAEYSIPLNRQDIRALIIVTIAFVGMGATSPGSWWPAAAWCVAGIVLVVVNYYAID